MIYQVDRKWMATIFNKFYGKMWVSFSIYKKTLLRTERPYVPLKNSNRDFWNSLLFKKEIVNVFNISALKQVFWNTDFFYKKLEYRLLVESTTNERVELPYQTSLSKANGKTKRMGSTITKSKILPGTTLFFWKFDWSIRTSYK